MDLFQKIKGGENRKLEFKEKMPSKLQLAKTSIAFANGAGGDILLGIDDSGIIVGINEKELNKISDDISNVIYDNCSPTIIPEIYYSNINNKTIIGIQITPGNRKPYYLKSRNIESGTYIRVGATNKPADPEFIRELERQSINQSYDEQIYSDESIEISNIAQINDIFNALTDKKVNQKDLENLKIICKVNNILKPTFGGLLISGNPEKFPQSVIQCAKFKGNDVNVFIDRKEFNGPLHQQVIDGINFAKTHVPLKGEIKGVQRKDSFSLPIEIIREILVNAVVHRDYSITGSNIKFAIFDNRIEITSPGTLPKTLDIHDIKIGRSEIRNKVIARFFREINFIEQWGTGIPKVFEICKKNNLKNPELIETGMFFKVVVYFEKKTTLKTTLKNTPKTTPKTLSDKIVSLIKNDSYITRDSIAEKLGISINTVKEYIRKLKSSERLLRHGSARNGYWEVIEK